MSAERPHQPWTPSTIARGDVRQALGVDGTDRARGNALNWELWREVLGLQLLCGPRVRSTRVASGDQTRRSREVAGHLEQLLRVIALVDATVGSQLLLPGVERDPTGLLALRGDALLALLGEGLVRLDGVFTTGGYLRSEFAPDGQARQVPAAIDYLARFASWRLEGDQGWAMPLRIGGKLVPAATPAGPAMGVGTFTYPNGGTSGTTLIQREADFLVIKEVQDTPAQRAALAALKDTLNALGDTQRAAIAKLFPVQQLAESQQKTDGKVLPETAALLARLEAELRRVNESLAALGANVTGRYGGFVSGDLLGGGVTDATATSQDAEVFEVWGSIDPYDLDAREELDEALRGTDPELYQDRARLAPHFYVSLDRMIGDDEPPPRKPPPEDGDPPPPEDDDQDSKPQPPPGGGGQPPPNPQAPAIFADPSAGGLPDEDSLIGLPSLGVVPSATAEAFTTETGNATNPHVLIADPDGEDAYDYGAGGKPDPEKPASTPCPIDDPLFGTPGSVFGPPDDFSTGGNPLDGLPFFPLPDVGTL